MIPTEDTDFDPEQHSDLALDLVYALEDFADELEASGETADEADMAAMGMPPIGLEQVTDMLGPAIAKKASRDRERTLRALALIHLEAGALIDEHTGKRPEELLQ